MVLPDHTGSVAGGSHHSETAEITRGFLLPDHTGSVAEGSRHFRPVLTRKRMLSFLRCVSLSRVRTKHISISSREPKHRFCNDIIMTIYTAVCTSDRVNTI